MHLIRFVRLYRRFRDKRHIAFSIVLGVVLLAMLGNAVCYYAFDGPGSNEASTMTIADALWYSVISITTIGYGDFYAESPGARLGTLFFIVIVGLGAFSFLIGMTIDSFMDIGARRRKGMTNVLANDHILIVNVPSESRLTQLIDEIKADPNYEGSEIVVVSDKIDELPKQHEHVLFVKGSVLEQETYERADLAKAKMAIVLATSYDDTTSDAIVASAVSVIDSINPDIYVVAECVNPRHKQLFDSVHCNSVIFSMGITSNLLVQEAQDPGIAQLFEVITSNARGTTLFSTLVSDTANSPQSYNEIARDLLPRDINVLCVNRGRESLTSLTGVSPETGDRIIYAAANRLTWDELLKQLIDNA
jgi:voltage-gated potassium channel